MKMQRFIVTVAALGSCISLAACKGSENATSPEQSGADATQSSTPDAKPGVTAGAARLVLPVVAGRPGVAYFRLTNNTASAMSLAGVHIAGVEKTEMHRTSGGKMNAVPNVDIAPGASIAFVPGGLHVMAFGVSNNLKPRDVSELTLTFADGDKVSLPLKVEAMGVGNGEAGMQH